MSNQSTKPLSNLSSLAGLSGSENDDLDNSSEFARVNRVMLPKSSDEYRLRRERNNAAVKKSRFKSKQRTLETQKRVDQLKAENSQLEKQVESLTKELNFMRAIFVPRRDSQIHPQAQHPNRRSPSDDSARGSNCE